MLPNPESNPKRREHQHKQNLSASVTVEVTNFPISLDPAMVIKTSHRRGLSLDQLAIGKQGYNPLYGSWNVCSPVSMGLMQQNPDGASIRRPSTPTQQMSPDSLPPTPATTPFWKPTSFFESIRTVPSSPTRQPSKRGMNIAKPLPLQRTKSLQGVAGSTLLPKSRNLSLQDTTPIDPFLFSEPQSAELGEFILAGLSLENLGDLELYASSLHSPVSPILSLPPFPEISGVPPFGVSNDKAGKIPIMPASPLKQTSKPTDTSSHCSSPVKVALSPRAMSIADLNLDANIDASIEETGITIDDIVAFIEGPDPVDNKWICTYGGCNKRFGRKENIKSHVQTHLGDRQFKCNHCNKCFVRGHDLKRHSKIHTGLKPYPCACGNSFARQDALTRHRQRGMCTGAFKDAVRKIVKRGRPRKHRPEIEELQEKPARTRERVNKKSYEPSISESSCFSLASPPSDSFETASIQGGSPAGNIELLNGDSFGLPPDVFTFTPPASPGHGMDNAPSPSRSYRSATPTVDGTFLSLSPTKRPLDNIPEEILELPLLAPASPTPIVKLDSKPSSPIQFLWPPSVESTLVESGTQDFDLFPSKETGSSLCSPHPLTLDNPSTGGFSEPRISSEYESDHFLDQSHAESSDPSAQCFSIAFSPDVEEFLHSFPSDVEDTVQVKDISW